MCIRDSVYLVPFTKCQLEIHEKCPDGLGTLITRRFMMRIAEKIAKKYGAQALITGESLGQVASQTMEALVCTDAVVDVYKRQMVVGAGVGDGLGVGTGVAVGATVGVGVAMAVGSTLGSLLA